MQAQGTTRRRRRCRSAPAAGRSSGSVTLPNIRWALLYGVLLCNARAMGEFGAVSVVSGHIRGADQHHAAAGRDPLQRVPVRRRPSPSPRCLPCWRSSRWSSRACSNGGCADASARAGRRRERNAGDRRMRRSRSSNCRSTGIRRISRAPGRRRRSTIASGELLALLGPSGSGKTTLLRIIAGLECPTAGRVLFGGEDATRAACSERSVGFVFQHYALFRHMTVVENVAFGLTRAGRATRARARPRSSARVDELLELVQLAGLREALSARSSPAASASASRWRARWRSSRACCCSTSRSARSTPRCARSCAAGCASIHDRPAITTIFVTHDQEEALELADRVVRHEPAAGSSRSARPTRSTTGRRRPSSTASSARPTR